jgi:hypothetical protein
MRSSERGDFAIDQARHLPAEEPEQLAFFEQPTNNPAAV